MIEDFKAPNFEPKSYANKILSESKLGQGLAILESHISQLNHKIQEIVLNSHHELTSNSSFAQLETQAAEFSSQLSKTQNKFQVIKEKSLSIWTEMAIKAKQLEVEHQKAQIAKALIRFLTLSKRLETAGQSDWHVVSGLVNECSDIVQEHDLLEINIVKEKWKFIQDLTVDIDQYAASLLSESIGKSKLDHVIIGLGIFLNLKKLNDKVEEIINTVLDNVSKMVQDGLDVEKISSKISIIGLNSLKASNAKRAVKRVNGPNISDSDSKAWALQLWDQVERMTENIYTECIKIYDLDKGLEGVGMESNQDVLGMIKIKLENGIGAYFWTNFSTILDKGIRSSIKGSTFLQQTFQAEYPRLLRLFHDFLSRIATFNGHTGCDFLKNSESKAILKVLSNFESAYLSKSLTRILDPINMCFPERVGGLSKISPKKDDVDKIIRVIGLEFEVVKFDSHLLKMVAKHVNKAIGLYLLKMEQIASLDSQTSVFGSGTTSHAQSSNVDVINCLWHLKETLYDLSLDYYGSNIFDSLIDQTESTANILKNVVEQLYVSITRELESIIVRIHKEDYQKNSSMISPAGKPPSLGYLREFTVKLKYNQSEILSKIKCDYESRSWIQVFIQRIIKYFIRQASIVRPLSENGKIKLADEITKFEFELSQFCHGFGIKLETDQILANSYKILRSFKPFLFLETNQLVEKAQLESLPRIIILHHLFVRAFPNLSLPPWHFSWTEGQYSDWLDKNESESLSLISQCCNIYAEEVKRRGEKEYCIEYPLILQVLKGAKDHV